MVFNNFAIHFEIIFKIEFNQHLFNSFKVNSHSIKFSVKEIIF